MWYVRWESLDYNYFAQLCLLLNHAMKQKLPCKYWLDKIVADYTFPHRINQFTDKKSIYITCAFVLQVSTYA